MATAAELLNRRIGRMEALASDLAALQPGYQPTELERQRARELGETLCRLYAPKPQAESEPEAPAGPDKKPGKK